MAGQPNTALAQRAYREVMAYAGARFLKIDPFGVVVHHGRGFYLVGMIARIIEEIACRRHLEPLSANDEKVGIVYAEVTNHVLKVVSSVEIGRASCRERV